MWPLGNLLANRGGVGCVYTGREGGWLGCSFEGECIGNFISSSAQVCLYFMNVDCVWGPVYLFYGFAISNLSGW